MKKILLVFALVVCSTAILLAQRTVSGTILDENSEALIGATVVGENTTIGTVTDFDGKYTLNVPEGTTRLVVSYTGYATQTLTLGASNVLDIVMAIDAVGLEDIIVTGYAPQKRKDITGSVSSVSVKDIENVQLPSFEAALQGRAAGVNVNKNSGTPGGGIDVNIRGRTSITASNQPLYVVDGVPLISGDNFDFTQQGVGNGQISVLADLNPEEIESIEVLKDASSAAIYGSRAANGVVLIKTKGGSSGGKTKVTLNASYGNQWLPNQIDVVDGPQYIEYITQVFGANIVGTEANNNWQDLIFQTGTLQKYSANISGGTDKTQFFGSLGFSGDEGIMRNSNFDRYSGRLNVKHIASDKLTFNMNVGYTKSETQQIQNDNNIFGALSTAILLPPVVPIRNEDGSFGSAFGLENPVAAVTQYSNFVDRNRLIGSVNASYNIIDDLSVNARLGVDLLSLTEDVLEPRTLQSSATGTAVFGTVTNNRFIHEYFLKYNAKVGGGSLQALAGLSFQEDALKNSFIEVVDFPTDDFTGISSGSTTVNALGAEQGDNLQSYFGNINYNYKGKYYLTATFRADGSSRFINNQWG